MVDARNTRDRWIKLEILEIKDGVRGIAMVEGRGHKSVPKERVRFILDGEPEGNQLVTDEEGIVKIDILNKSPGKHVLQAKVVGYGAVDTKTFTVSQKAKPSSFRVMHYRQDGNSHHFTLCVKDADSKPLVGSVLEVADPNQEPRPTSPSDKNGEIHHEVEFPGGKERLPVSFWIPGVNNKITRWIYLA